MTREEAERLLRGGQDGVREWNSRRGKNTLIPPLDGIKLYDQNLTGAKLGGLSLVNAQLARATLTNADFTRSNLTGAGLFNAQAPDCTFTTAVLRNARLSTGNFAGANFHGADLSGADVVGSDLRHAWFLEAKVIGTHGLFGDGKATQYRIQDGELAHFRKHWDRLDWETLKLIGSIPLFGVSNAAVVAIIVYAAAIRWFNAQIMRLRGAVEDLAPESQWVGYLTAIPVDVWIGLLLLALAILAIGAGTYKFRCPNIVQEYSWVKWVSELKLPPLEYGSAKYSKRTLRYASAVCYVLGGGYVVCYLAVRVVKALVFLLGGE